MRKVGAVLAIWVACFGILMGVGALVPDAHAATVTNSDARNYTAGFIRKNYGANLNVLVARECPVVSRTVQGWGVRRCYFRVPPQVYARSSCGYYQPFAGYVRSWLEPDQRIHGRQTGSWCLGV